MSYVRYQINDKTYQLADIERFRKAKATIIAIFGGFMTAVFGGLLIWGMTLKRGGFYIGGEWVFVLGLLAVTVRQTIKVKERG